MQTNVTIVVIVLNEVLKPYDQWVLLWWTNMLDNWNEEVWAQYYWRPDGSI